jgi:hypothetical protein
MRNTLTITAAALLLTGGSLMAQQPETPPAGGGIGLNIQAAREKLNKKVEPPTLNLKSEETATWPMIATVIIVVSCVLVAIIPPKRGHQD